MKHLGLTVLSTALVLALACGVSSVKPALRSGKEVRSQTHSFRGVNVNVNQPIGRDAQQGADILRLTIEVLRDVNDGQPEVLPLVHNRFL